MSGYWAIGSMNTASEPARVMMIDSTAAKIGRRMKKWESTAECSVVQWLGGSVAGGLP